MTMDAITLGNRMNQLVVQENGAGFDWAERCEQNIWYAIWAANGLYSKQGYASALKDYQASRIESLDMNAAPAGSVSFYAKSQYWHVVVNLGNGFCINTSPLMKGKGLVEFGRNLRITRLADYYPDLYKGWSLGSGTRPQIDVAPWAPAGPAPAPNQPGVAWAFNPPSRAVQASIQASLKARKRYSGPADGAFGVNSIKGIQTTIKNVGYQGVVDGVPGPNTCHFIQVYAQKWGGYRGPIDSVLGPNSWAGFAAGVYKR